MIGVLIDVFMIEGAAPTCQRVTIVTDSVPGFKALENNELLYHHYISIKIENSKNPNNRKISSRKHSSKVIHLVKKSLQFPLQITMNVRV